jgi:hypothetical protein
MANIINTKAPEIIKMILNKFLFLFGGSVILILDGVSIVDGVPIISSSIGQSLLIFELLLISLF